MLMADMIEEMQHSPYERQPMAALQISQGIFMRITLITFTPDEYLIHA